MGSQVSAESEKKAKEATDALNQYREAEKKALIDSITQRSQFTADELKDKTVEELRLTHMAIDKAKRKRNRDGSNMWT